MDGWAAVEPMLRDLAHRTIEADPQILLEQDGGPVGATADVFVARLLGLEDEIVADGIRLSRPEPVILQPVPSRPDMVSEAPHAAALLMRTARYVMQSGFAQVTVDGRYAPADVEVRPDGTFRVLFLRYRRRG